MGGLKVKLRRVGEPTVPSSEIVLIKHILDFCRRDAASIILQASYASVKQEIDLLRRVDDDVTCFQDPTYSWD